MMGVVLQEGLALYPQGFPPEIVEPFAEGDGRPGDPREPRRERHGHHPGARRGAPADRQAHRLHVGRLGLPDRRATRRRCRSRRSTRWCASRAGCSTRSGWRGSSRGRSWGRRASTSAPTTARTSRSRRRGGPCSSGSSSASVPVVGVGKIPDIFDRKGITDEVHTEGNADGLAKTEALLEPRRPRPRLREPRRLRHALRPPERPARATRRALEELDRALPRLFGKLRPDDVCAHHRGPRLRSDDAVHRPLPRVRPAPRPRARAGGGKLGTRPSFADLGATVSRSSSASGRTSARASSPRSGSSCRGLAPPGASPSGCRSPSRPRPPSGSRVPRSVPVRGSRAAAAAPPPFAQHRPGSHPTGSSPFARRIARWAGRRSSVPLNR